MNAWEEYLTAAQGLDAVRRSAVAAAAEQRGALRVARQELAAACRRLALQQQRLVELARRSAVRLPALEPSDAEVSAAPVAGGPSFLLAALHQAQSAMDGADAELAAADVSKTRAPLARLRRLARLADRPPARRDLAVYAVFALVVLVLSTCAGFGVSALLD